MKKYTGYFIAAFMGGMIALGSYLLISPQQEDVFREASLDENMPVYQTSDSYTASKQIVAPDFGAAADKTVNAVVHIKTEYKRSESQYNDFFEFFGGGSAYPPTASGSGVIIDDNGYIVTNNHVVEAADKITVTLNDKRTFEAEVVGLDPNTDLGLIRIEAANLPYLSMGNSDELSVGEWVLAVGNPFNLTSTVTAGIVSAKARNINILGRRSAIESFIQTDAAVNRGNSGGALVNTKGELVGINAAIASNTGSYAGYSFAIPVNIARKVINDLKEYGIVQRAYIGVTIRELTGALAREHGIKDMNGVYVDGVEEDGAAEDAGLKSGDVIVAVDGKPVNSSGRLLELIAQYNPGDGVKVSYIRDNKRKSVELILEGMHGETRVMPKEELNGMKMRGASLRELDKDQLDKHGLDFGIQVTELGVGKLQSAGVREGFIITSVDREKVKSVDEFKKILSGKEGGVLLEGIYPNGMRAYYGFGL